MVNHFAIGNIDGVITLIGKGEVLKTSSKLARAV